MPKPFSPKPHSMFKRGGTRKAKGTLLRECGDCPAICCHDLSITVLKPRTRKEIDDLKWHLNYDSVGVYVRGNRWHVIVKGRCIYLDNDNMCTIYENRFDKCRNHTPPVCERFDDWYDVLFTEPDELEAYLSEQKRRWSGKEAKKARGKAKKK